MLALRQAIATFAALALIACNTGTESTAPPGAPDLSVEGAAQGGASSVTGTGVFQLGGTVPTDFHFLAVQLPTGSSEGFMRFYTEDEGFIYDFEGQVTCLAIDEANHRAWLGGVITHNGTTDPALQQPIHQVGQDLWFRMVDHGEGPEAGDRMTFVGFKGTAGIQTSAEYCQRRLWLNEGQRVVEGGLSVHP